jgi:hypothetical protein
VQGLHETFKKTPVMAQLETKAPPPASFLHTRTQSPPVPTPHRVRMRTQGPWPSHGERPGGMLDP